MNVVSAVFFQLLNKQTDRQSLVLFSIIVALEHLNKCPLSPMIVFRIASSDLSFPIERKADLI